jgi:DNA-binding GntR family transcriptional regulator
MGMIEGLWLQIGPVLNLDVRAGPERVRQGEAHLHHARLVAALKARDSDAARDALVADIWSAGDFILSRDVLPD